MSEFQHPHPDLADAFTSWQQTKDSLAAAELINAFGGLVRYRTYQFAPGLGYGGGAIDRDDLVAVGYRAILNAADRYEPERCKQFSTLAVTAIRGAATREFYRHAHAVYLPPDQARLAQHIRRCVVAQLEQGLPPPTDPEIEAARIASTQPKIKPMAFTQKNEIPPYNDLLKLWDAGSWEAYLEDEEELGVDPYTGEAIDDKEQLRDHAIIISNEHHESYITDCAESNLTAERVRRLIAKVYADVTDDSINPEYEKPTDIKREWVALTLYFGLDGLREHSLNEIATALGIRITAQQAGSNAGHRQRRVRDQVSSIVRHGIKRLREYAENRGLTSADF